MVISSEDMAVVDSTLLGVTDPGDIEELIEIHTKVLEKSKLRRQELLNELKSVDRSIVMREYALVQLKGLQAKLKELQ